MIAEERALMCYGVLVFPLWRKNVVKFCCRANDGCQTGKWPRTWTRIK